MIFSILQRLDKEILTKSAIYKLLIKINCARFLPLCDFILGTWLKKFEPNAEWTKLNLQHWRTCVRTRWVTLNIKGKIQRLKLLKRLLPRSVLRWENYIASWIRSCEQDIPNRHLKQLPAHAYVLIKCIENCRSCLTMFCTAASFSVTESLQILFPCGAHPKDACQVNLQSGFQLNAGMGWRLWRVSRIKSGRGRKRLDKTGTRSSSLSHNTVEKRSERIREMCALNAAKVRQWFSDLLSVGREPRIVNTKFC